MDCLSLALLSDKESVNGNKSVMTCHAQYTLEELVIRAQFGRTDAFDKLIDMFHKDIFRLVYYRIRSQADAEDITQEIFVKVFKGIKRLKDPEKFKSWLYTIALNCVKDFSRKKVWTIFQFSNDEEDEPEIPDNQLNPEEQIVQKEFWDNFRSFTETLSKQEREVFILRFLDNLGIREISEGLKRNESTVKTHLYRAVKKFKNNKRFHSFLKGGLS